MGQEVGQDAENHEPEKDNFFTPKNDGFPYDKVYPSLNEDDNQIRLISIAPGSGTQPISCQLSTFSLSNPPPYNALSYCAGNPDDCGQIQLNGYSFNVFKSLYSALRHLRRPDQSISMWVDQLCINQKNISERNGQVLKMRAIYECATTTRVWLGDPHKYNDAMFNLLERFCTLQKPQIYASIRKLTERRQADGPVRARTDQHSDEIAESDSVKSLLEWTDSLYSSRHVDDREIIEGPLKEVIQWLINESDDTSQSAAWTGLQDLFERPYWSRIWILQEIAVSRRIVLHCGLRHIGWYDLYLFTICVAHLTTPRFDMPINGILHEFYDANLLDFEEVRRNQGENKRSNECLYDILSNFTHYFSASDPRDKIYALLGLTGKYNMKYGIKLDYSQATTTLDVYVAAVKAIIRVDREYPFDFVGIHTAHSVMPSWLLDFEDVRDFTLKPGKPVRIGGPGIPTADFSDDNKTMTIPGIKVARLNQDLTEAYNPSDEKTQPLKAWITLVIRYFSDRASLTSKVIHDFLTVIWGTSLRPPQLTSLKHDDEDILQTLMDLVVSHHSLLARTRDSSKFFIIGDDIACNAMMGLVPAHAKLGDWIFVPRAGERPIAIRETETQGQFIVIGECCVHGIMNGELFDENGVLLKHEFTKIDLV